MDSRINRKVVTCHVCLLHDELQEYRQGFVMWFYLLLWHFTNLVLNVHLGCIHGYPWVVQGR